MLPVALDHGELLAARDDLVLAVAIDVRDRDRAHEVEIAGSNAPAHLAAARIERDDSAVVGAEDDLLGAVAVQVAEGHAVVHADRRLPRRLRPDLVAPDRLLGLAAHRGHEVAVLALEAARHVVGHVIAVQVDDEHAGLHEAAEAREDPLALSALAVDDVHVIPERAEHDLGPRIVVDDSRSPAGCRCSPHGRTRRSSASCPSSRRRRARSCRSSSARRARAGRRRRHRRSAATRRGSRAAGDRAATASSRAPCRPCLSGRARARRRSSSRRPRRARHRRRHPRRTLRRRSSSRSARSRAGRAASARGAAWRGGERGELGASRSAPSWTRPDHITHE